MPYLTDVSIPDSVKTISYYAFFYCESISYIGIPESVEKICYGAFDRCANLEHITFYNSSAVIEDSAYIEHPVSETTLTIQGWAGSTAQTYAEQNNITFVPFAYSLRLINMDSCGTIKGDLVHFTIPELRNAMHRMLDGEKAGRAR